MRLAENPSRKKDEVHIGQTVGSYRIVGELGRGGMGVVYEAVHEHIGQRAAVKVLSGQVSSQPQFGSSLLDEARAISMVRHPGLVKVYDFNRLPDGTVYIMMEYLEGDSLWQRYTRLKHEGTWLTLNKAVQLGRQIASTLAAVHRQSIVHRDLKPENIMLVEDPDVPLGERAKLLDFGIAKLRTSSPARTETEFGTILGTPAYMSPEQFLEEELDGQSDVYSLGAMLYEMVSGKPPFEGRKWGELALKHLQEPPVPLRQLVAQVPEALDVLIQEMLAKDLNQRPVMAQVVDRLDALAEFLRTGAPVAGGRTEVFSKIDPEELFGTPSVEELPNPLRKRPGGLWMFEQPQPPVATPAPSVVDHAAPGEARTIRNVTLALALATGFFLLCVQLLSHPPTPPSAEIAAAMTPPSTMTATSPAAPTAASLLRHTFQRPTRTKSSKPSGALSKSP